MKMIANRGKMMVIGAAVLLTAVFIGTVLTAPISELDVVLRNWETDTVSITMKLDDSRAGHLYYVKGGQSIDLLVHVSPGTHSLSFFALFGGGGDGIADFIWEVRVGFNDFEFIWLEVSTGGIEERPMVSPGSDESPIHQALTDPGVIIPSALLIVTIVTLTVCAWNYGRQLGAH